MEADPTRQSHFPTFPKSDRFWKLTGAYLIAHWRGLLGLRWTCLLGGFFVLAFGYLLVWVRIFIGWATPGNRSPLTFDVIITAFSLSVFWYLVGVVRSSWRTLFEVPATTSNLLGAVVSLTVASAIGLALANYLRQAFGF